MRKTPEEWLAEASPPSKTRGVLKLFVGYAPGVGKTYRMLSEAIRRRSRGQDVVIGLVETHGRQVIAELAAELETVPRRKIEYKGTVFEEMDLDAILARHPGVVLVDELAHTNIPGSKNCKRYEDIVELLEANIDVLSTINIQHLESMAPLVESITGVTVRETVPDAVLKTAGETEMVDLTPEALENRMKRGDIYNLAKVDQALRNFFRRGNLIALRELALNQVAEQVDRSLVSHMASEDIKDSWAVRERVAVFVSAKPVAQYLIARAARMARRMHAVLKVVHVDLENENPQDPKSLEANLQFATNLGGEVVRLKGKSVAEAAGKFVAENHVTHAIFGRSAVTGWQKLLYMWAISRFLRDAPGVDLHIVAQEQEAD